MKPTILNQLKNKTHKDTNMTYLEKRLGLTSMKNITNMHLYNERDQICKFTNVIDIIKYFYKLRLDLYVKRKNYMEAQLQKELDVLEAKVRFITDFIEGNVELRNKRKQRFSNNLKL